jgi:hypothetical protein
VLLENTLSLRPCTDLSVSYLLQNTDLATEKEALHKLFKSTTSYSAPDLSHSFTKEKLPEQNLCSSDSHDDA